MDSRNGGENGEVNLLSIKEYKPIIILGVFLVAVIGFIYVVSLYWPKYEEYFFELGLLGKEGKAEGYFPSDDSTIHIGTPMSWNIYVHNHMGSKQWVSIKVRILNSTMQAPDDREHEPSPEPCVLEIPFSLSVDETVLVPYSWSILDAEYRNGTVIYSIIVNNEIYDISLSDNSTRFRYVFEIWVYDELLDDYSFGWYSKGEFYSASVYIWFNLNLAYLV